MQPCEPQVSSVPVSSVPPRMGTEGTDGRGTKSPLPIHSFHEITERMGTEGTDGVNKSASDVLARDLRELNN